MHRTHAHPRPPRTRRVLAAFTLASLVIAGCAGSPAPTAVPATPEAPASSAPAVTTAPATSSAPAASAAPAAPSAPAASAATTSLASPAAPTASDAVARGASGGLVGVIVCFLNRSGRSVQVRVLKTEAGIGDAGTFDLPAWGKQCMSRPRNRTESANTYEFGARAILTSPGVDDLEVRAWVTNAAPDVAVYGTLIRGRIDQSTLAAPWQNRRFDLGGIDGVRVSRIGDNSGWAQVEMEYGAG